MNGSSRIISIIGRSRRSARIALFASVLPANLFGTAASEALPPQASRALRSTPPDTADPAKALARSLTPLNVVETLLEGERREPVQAYLEALAATGQADAVNRVRCLQEIYNGNYAGAQQALEILRTEPADRRSHAPGTASGDARAALPQPHLPGASRRADDAWAVSRANYLTGLLSLQAGFTETRSDHFVLRAPTEDVFLADYALPALETAHAKFTELLGSSPSRPVVVEIYPTAESFSFASTLSREALERSGAVGVCKFGRLMILSPRATAMGYRWLDALVHEFAHLTVNRLSGGQCPLWLNEGTARYLEFLWRRPEGYAPPPGDEALLAAAVGATLADRDVPAADQAIPGGLLPFATMEPSFVYLPDQPTVALAYAETADAVADTVNEHGLDKFRALLEAFSRLSRASAFTSTLGVSESEVESSWRESFSTGTWKAAQGALVQTIHLGLADDLLGVGADVGGHLRLGDRLRRNNQLAAARSEYKKAVALEPDNGVALTRLARAEIFAGRTAAAEPLLRRAMDMNPSYAAPFVLSADLDFDDGRYEDAQAKLQGALEINPFHPKIHEILGLIAIDVGNFPAARESLLLALRFDPDNDAVRQALKRMPDNR